MTLFSGSQTDPCFLNKNSGCRLTGGVYIMAPPKFKNYVLDQKKTARYCKKRNNKKKLANKDFKHTDLLYRDNNIFFPMNWTFHLSCDRIQTNDCIFNPIQRAPPLGVEYRIQLKRVTSPFRSPDVGPSFDILSITTPEVTLPISTPINCGAKEVVAQVSSYIFKKLC